MQTILNCPRCGAPIKEVRWLYGVWLTDEEVYAALAEMEAGTRRPAQPPRPTAWPCGHEVTRRASEREGGARYGRA